MNKNRRSITLLIYSLLLILISAVTFAQPKEAPNQLITDNPYREVTTVDANKNRDHAEINITVNKLISEKLSGEQISENIMMYRLPSDPENQGVLVTENADDFEDLLNKKATKNQIPFTFSEGSTVKVNSLNPVFIGVVNNRNELKKVYFTQGEYATQNVVENFDFTNGADRIEGTSHVNIANPFYVDITYLSKLTDGKKISIKEEKTSVKSNFESIELVKGLFLYKGHKILGAENKDMGRLIAEEGYIVEITNPGNNEKQEVKGYFRNHKVYNIMEGKIFGSTPLVSKEIEKLYMGSDDDVVRTLDIYVNGKMVQHDVEAQELLNGVFIDELKLELKARSSGNNWVIMATKKGNGTVPEASIKIDVKSSFMHNIYGNLPIVTYILNLNLAVDLGEMVFDVDRRLQMSFKTASHWLRGDGKIISSVKSDADYNAMIDIKGNFEESSVKIKDIISMDRRSSSGDINLDGKEYEIFSVKGGTRDQSAVPKGIPVSQLKEYAVIPMYNSENSDFLNNSFTLMGEDTREYSGNIRENYVGEEAKEGQATLDMAHINIDETLVWNTTGKRKAESTDGKGNLVFTNGELFNWNSYVGNRSSHIVTKLVVESEGKTEEINGDIGEKLQASFPDNNIGISNEGLFITKRTNNGKARVYTVKAYHNEVFLGSLEVKILNGYSFVIEETGELDFGEFIPGQEKTAETKLSFTKPVEVNVDLVVSENSNNNMFKENSEINENTTIPIDDIVIKKETGTARELTESFTVSAKGKTGKNTEKGKYSGTLELEITVIP